MGDVPVFPPWTRCLLCHILPGGEERDRKLSVKVCWYFYLLPSAGPLLPSPALRVAQLPRLLSLPSIQVSGATEERARPCAPNKSRSTSGFVEIQ